MSQNTQYSFSLAMAQSTLYSHQLRLSSVLVPLNARLEALNGVAEEEDSEVVVLEELEEDTL